MVPQAGEHHLLIFLGRLPYPLQRLLQPFPILCSAVGVLLRIPLGQIPSLQRLRRQCLGTPFVHRLLRYYGPVRLPGTVHHRITPWIRGADTLPSALPALGSPDSRSVSFLACPALRPRRGQTALCLCDPSDVAFPYSKKVGPPNVAQLSRSITQPASSPVNACTIPSQV